MRTQEFLKYAGAVVASLVCLTPLLSAQQAAPYSEAARRSFARLLKIPASPPEVKVTVAGSKTEEGLVVEDISWESLDGERVPAYVIHPANVSGRLPAVICLHGSSGSRDSVAAKQYGIGEWRQPGREKPHKRMLGWGRELARHGYLTLSLTQRGLDTRKPFVNELAKILLVHGRTAMGAVIYEIRQGVSYLVSRPDVDPARIGATGMSFGGITAFYVWVVDDRVEASAPLCGGVGSVDIFSRKGHTGFHGTYWWVPGLVPAGDQAAFAAAMAPRPLMLWAPTEDVGMVKEGVDEFIRKVTPAYERAGAKSAFVVHQPPGTHHFTPEAFQAMKEFFDQHLKGQ